MRRINYNNILIILSLSLILIVGLFMVYSSSSIWAYYMFEDKYYYLKRQLIFVLIGIILMFFASKIRLDKIRKHSTISLLIGFLMLILVLVPLFSVEINGSRSWYKIGSFLFQPSELFKLIIVFYMADRLDKYYNVTTHFFKTIMILLIPTLLAFLLIMLQPDFGTGVVMLGAIIMMCVLSKNRFKNYLVLGGIALFAFIILISTSDYRSERIDAFINPYSDPLGSGFQAIQSMYAIGPGGLIGKGIDGSYQKYFYLPEPQTDFIFSIYAEDYGFVGCVILVGLYTLLIGAMFNKAMSEKSTFKAYLDIGIASLIVIQVCINLCVVVGLIPVTGITLPFMSYGGSSITMLLAGIGFILNKEDENEYFNVR